MAKSNITPCDVFQVSTTQLIIEFDTFANLPKKSLYVKNISEVPQVLHLKMPLSPYFSVDYFVPKGKVLPNKSAEINIKCINSLEKRLYYDRLTVMCSRGCGFVVKIMASLRNENVLKIPAQINMGIVPLGEVATAELTLPPVHERMPFMVMCSTCCPELSITPWKGIVEDTSVTILISYQPLAYVTACITLHLYLPTLTALPYFVIINADTKPGLIGDLISQAVSNLPEKLEPLAIRKIPRSKLPKLQQKSSILDSDTTWSHHRTNMFLMRKERIEASSHELLGPLGRSFSIDEKIKMTKQELFFRELEIFKEREADAVLHKLEFTLKPIPVERSIWDQLWQEYEHDKNEFSDLYVNCLNSSVIQPRRPIISINKEPDLLFTNRKGSLWFIRYRALNRFIQSVRTVIVQTRLMKRLEVLKSTTGNETLNWRRG